MTDKKLNVIELNLGIDPVQELISAKPSESTANKIEAKIQHEVTEQSTMIAIRNRKKAEEDKKEAAAEKATSILIALAKDNKSIASVDLMSTSEAVDLSSLILRIKAILRKNNLWELKKKQVNKASHYYLIPTASPTA